MENTSASGAEERGFKSRRARPSSKVKYYRSIRVFLLEFAHVPPEFLLFTIKDKVEHLYSVKLIFLNPQLFFSLKQAKSAVIHALRAFMGGNNLSKKLEIEILCYLIGERQISKMKEKNNLASPCLLVLFLYNRKRELSRATRLLCRFLMERGLIASMPCLQSPQKKAFKSHDVNRKLIAKTRLPGESIQERAEKLMLERVALLDLFKLKKL